MYLSPYVEEPLNSKVIKSFVPELRSRKCFLCFEIPMFYVHIYEHYMSISPICIWLWYNAKDLGTAKERVAQNWIRRFKGGDTSLKDKPSQEDLLF